FAHCLRCLKDRASLQRSVRISSRRLSWAGVPSARRAAAAWSNSRGIARLEGRDHAGRNASIVKRKCEFWRMIAGSKLTCGWKKSPTLDAPRKRRLRIGFRKGRQSKKNRRVWRAGNGEVRRLGSVRGNRISRRSCGAYQFQWRPGEQEFVSLVFGKLVEVEILEICDAMPHDEIHVAINGLGWHDRWKCFQCPGIGTDHCDFSGPKIIAQLRMGARFAIARLGQVFRQLLIALDLLPCR